MIFPGRSAPVDEAACRRVYEFGVFRLDASRRVLSIAHDGVRIPISPKAFDAALYFVQRPGELIPKQRMLAGLWPDAVVEENSLTQVISELRHALGETRGENLYIVTVPRRGYQFVAEVTRIALAPTAPVAPGPSIAVMPFDNPGQATEDAVLATGIQGSIEHRLTGLRGLRLVAHGSPSRPSHDGIPSGARTLGRRLGARYLVQGTVQHLGPRLRVTTQLVDAADGSHLWSLCFDRTAGDLFALEDEIAQQVACSVCRSLLGTADVDGIERPAPNDVAGA